MDDAAGGMVPELSPKPMRIPSRSPLQWRPPVQWRPGAIVALLLLVAAALVGGPLLADDTSAWHPTLEKGVAAAKKSSRPLFVVTIWREKVCNACDTWRKRVPTNDDVQHEFGRFELVEWQYDGLGGKVIPWTQEHGGTSDDPAVQVFVAAADGKVLSRAPDSLTYAPAQLARWLADHADVYEREHPRTAVPFELAKVAVHHERTTSMVASEALDAAREAGKPVLLLVGRESLGAEPDDAAKAELEATRKLEKKVLAKKDLVAATQGWVLLRLDVARPEHAQLATALGAKKRPTLLAIVPGTETPTDLGADLTAAKLVYQLKKLRE